MNTDRITRRVEYLLADGTKTAGEAIAQAVTEADQPDPSEAMREAA